MSLIFSKIDYLYPFHIRRSFMRDTWHFDCTCIACRKMLFAKRIECFDFAITLSDFNISLKKVTSQRKLEKWFKAQLREVISVSKHESHSKRLLLLVLDYLFPNAKFVNFMH